MVAFPALPEISDEESEWLESIFNSEYHGEIRIERDDLAKRFTINWFDSCISAHSILELNTRAEKDWASTFTRLHDEYLKNNEKVKLIEALELDNQHLKDQLALLKDDIYGTSYEQSISPKVDIEEPNPPTNVVTPDFTNQDKAQRSAPSNAGRKPLPPELPRESVNYQLPAEEQVCPCCVAKLTRCGEEVFERISVIPEHYRVIKHIQHKYVCRTCNRFSMAPAPKSILPGSSFASPEFLASVAVKRFQYGLPYYRQEQIFNSMGLPFNRTTLANLMINASDKLTSVYELAQTSVNHCCGILSSN